jgi:hypothetical protein
MFRTKFKTSNRCLDKMREKEEKKNIDEEEPKLEVKE